MTRSFLPGCLVVLFLLTSPGGRGQELRSIPSPAESILSPVMFSPDWKLLVAADGGFAFLWDLASKKQMWKIGPPGGSLRATVFSPDGKMIALSADDGPRIKGSTVVLEVATGKEICSLEGDNTKAKSAVFSPDGKFLVTTTGGDKVFLWDALTGKQLRVMPGHPACVGRCEALAFSPDGRLIVSGGADDSVRFWNAETGEQVGVLEMPYEVAGLRFSSDGRSLVATHGEISVIEVATRRERCRLRGEKSEGFSRALFSRDGRFVFGAGISHSRDEGYKPVVRTWDLSNGHEAREVFEPHKKWLWDLALAPDGKTLATFGDRIVRLWDISKLKDQFFIPYALKEKDLPKLWDSLAKDDAKKAHDTIWSLIPHPDKAVPFLKEHLPGQKPLTTEQVQKLKRAVENLHDEKFDIREQAEKDIEEYGEFAETLLRQELKDNPPADVKRSLERLLTKLDRDAPLSGELLRSIRSIEILEHIGTDDAKQILKSLSEPKPQTWIGREAEASLRRLKASSVKEK